MLDRFEGGDFEIKLTSLNQLEMLASKKNDGVFWLVFESAEGRVFFQNLAIDSGSKIMVPFLVAGIQFFVQSWSRPKLFPVKMGDTFYKRCFGFRFVNGMPYCINLW